MPKKSKHFTASQWTIVIQGHGPYGNGVPYDTEVIAGEIRKLLARHEPQTVSRLDLVLGDRIDLLIDAAEEDETRDSGPRGMPAYPA